MNMNNGCRNKKVFLRMPEMNLAGLSTIQIFLRMIQKTEKLHLNFESRLLMKMANRKRESERAKAQSIFGKKYLFRLMIGMSIFKLKNGEHPGLNIAIDISIRSNR